MSTSLSINLSAHPEDQEQAVAVAEAFSRLATGLALEGIYVTMNYVTVEIGGAEEIDDDEENPNA